MTNPNRQVALSFYDHLNHRNLDAIESLTSDAYVGHGFGDEGPASLRRDLEGLLGAFSDLRVDIQQSIADGDRVAVRMTMTGTHTGDFAGIPASGNTIEPSDLPSRVVTLLSITRSPVRPPPQAPRPKALHQRRSLRRLAPRRRCLRPACGRRPASAPPPGAPS